MAGEPRASGPRLFLIVAVSRNGVIGRDGELPWRLPADLAYFKRVTTGHPIVMGRKTFESIGRPLPDRRNIVLSRSLERAPDGCELFRSLEEALDALNVHERAFVIGGAELYRLALPMAERVYLTRVEAEVDGDVHFGRLEAAEWRRISTEAHPADERNPIAYSFEVWERRA